MDIEMEVKCPTCGRTKTINVPDSVLPEKKFSFNRFKIGTGMVCPDEFLVFVDNQGKARGYEKLDLCLAPIKEDSKAKAEATSLKLKELTKIFTFKRFLKLLHAKIFNYPIYLIRDENIQKLESNLDSFLNDLMPADYQCANTIKFIDEPFYFTIKEKAQNTLFINTTDILQVPWNEKLKFEDNILKKAIQIMTPDDQFLLLKEFIRRFVEEVNVACKILNYETIITDSELIERISKQLNAPKIDNYRLLLIMIFIKQQVSSSLETKIQTKLRKKMI